MERRGDHGLFRNREAVSLPDTITEVEQHQGPVWTVIYSLRREDAAALGYEKAAEQGNQYDPYTPGKLYLMGEDVSQDREQTYSWLWESASQGNEYAQFLLDYVNDNYTPNVPLSVTSLLHHMGQIFQDNSVPPSPPASQQADGKYRRRFIRSVLPKGTSG